MSNLKKRVFRKLLSKVVKPVIIIKSLAVNLNRGKEKENEKALFMDNRSCYFILGIDRRGYGWGG